jgi:hypothetical protein
LAGTHRIAFVQLDAGNPSRHWRTDHVTVAGSRLAIFVCRHLERPAPHCAYFDRNRLGHEAPRDRAYRNHTKGGVK